MITSNRTNLNVRCPPSNGLQPQFERLEDRRLLAAWQNPHLSCDVDDSGDVTPQDVLLVVQDLNMRHARSLTNTMPLTTPTHFVDINGDDFVSAIDPLLIINALRQNSQTLSLVLSIDPADDPNGNGVVLTDQVKLRGQTATRARIDLTTSGLDAKFQVVDSMRRLQTVRADADGRFIFQQALFPGLNRLTAVTTDALGRQVTVAREIVRGDIVADWNAALLNGVRDWTTTSDDPYPGRIVPSAPPVVARNLAMIHVAMFDAMNGVDGAYTPYLATLAPAPNTSALAASTSAAYEVAAALYPLAKERAVLDVTLSESLKSIPESPAKQLGITYGKQVANRLLAECANDSAKAIITYTSSGQPGGWAWTSPDFLPPLLAHWCNLQSTPTQNCLLTGVKEGIHTRICCREAVMRSRNTIYKWSCSRSRHGSKPKNRRW